VKHIKVDKRRVEFKADKLPGHGPRSGSVVDFDMNGVTSAGSAIRHLLQEGQFGR
jgi:hypothetical protein